MIYAETSSTNTLLRTVSRSPWISRRPKLTTLALLKKLHLREETEQFSNMTAVALARENIVPAPSPCRTNIPDRHHQHPT